MSLPIVKGHWLSEVERDREAHVRLLDCPDCSAEAFEKCRYGYEVNGNSCQFSHTGRYLWAQQAGLVPPLPG